jgi:hypothetical protein
MRPALDIIVMDGHVAIAAIGLLILLFLSGWAWGYDNGYSEGLGKRRRNNKPTKQRKREKAPPPDWFEDY